MSRKSPSLLKILNDTLDLMTLMTHYSSVWQVCFTLYAIRTRHLQKIIKIRGKNLFV